MKLFLLVLPQFAGIIGSVFTIPSIPGWYETLVQPSFRPPNWVFGPVWTVLYLCMGIAASRVWVRKGALKTYYIQLALNLLWSILFFGFHAPGIAFIEILLLWVMIIMTMNTFYKIDKLAGYLFVPYSMWVTFAAVLNASIWYLNQ